ncbi:ABC transporter permease [Goodfellowiella coeruleoviolacea]|uniref:Transport permease protein n=1 Tax=Goodfellowiella coeruleoviolacea TaxID=334858 RepID=A0AAE3GDF2_9PSEU|nr:ABC transporter permease [Goodfellowiella coeruleoviolacea]MCP2165209.1 ABC-2 type transport system permease protein [Goodfellowiella coeruleoviolacea]
MRKFLQDTVTSFHREIRPELRQPWGIVLAMAQPVLFLVLFGSVLTGPHSGFGGAETTWQWFVPGILIMMCLVGPLSCGHQLLSESSGGQLERILVTPVHRAALITGRTLKESVTLCAQAVLIIAIATPFGLTPHIPGALATMLLLTVLGIGLSAFSHLLAIAARPSGNLFWVATQLLLFPLMLLSGVLLPISAGPAWLRGLAAVNPVAYVVDAARALFAGQFLAPAVLPGVVAVAVVTALGLGLATRALRRGS